MGDILDRGKKLMGNTTESSSEGGMFDSLKFWKGNKEAEQKEIIDETKSSLSSMFTKLLVIAQGLGVQTDLNQETFEDGMNDKDDKWYELLDDSKEEVDELLASIASSISNNSQFATKYGSLVDNIKSYQGGGPERLSSLKKIPGLGSFITSITEWISQNKILDKIFNLDQSKLLKKINTELDQLALELQGGTSVDPDGSSQTNSASNTPANNENPPSIHGLRGSLVNPFGSGAVVVTGVFNEERGDHQHAGIDLVKSGKEQPLCAAATMKIIKKDNQPDGAGYYVKAVMVDQGGRPIKIDGEHIVFSYFHLSELPQVNTGDIIQKGDYFAHEGNTGHSTGEHLHFEIEHGKRKVDPLDAFDPQIFSYKQDGKVVAYEDRKHADKYDNLTQAA